MATKQKLLFVTGNKNKLAEMQALLGEHFQLDSINIDLPEIQGSSHEIAREKCRKAAEIAKGPVYVEDTGLGFGALKGLPGPYIKWFLDKIGVEGLVKMLEGYSDKSADAFCTIAYCAGPGSEPILFDASVKGSIVDPVGPRTFGWDPIFKPDGYEDTYASMDTNIKNKISHRYKSVIKFREYLEKEYELRKSLAVVE
ncbi:nucleoside triphosphate pyrophosphohydrolase ham1 [Entomortierella beljakovae]|nr:nucleoside triphosphate pyrophosphohydrolase ham1 [Entomortierella beljakovae]